MSFYVYMATNKPSGVLYIGMTDDLNRRMWEHKEHIRQGFTDTYNCEQLVWFEVHDTREAAFTRERRLKFWKRAWKIDLITQTNPNWEDLSAEFL